MFQAPAGLAHLARTSRGYAGRLLTVSTLKLLWPPVCGFLLGLGVAAVPIAWIADHTWTAERTGILCGFVGLLGIFIWREYMTWRLFRMTWSQLDENSHMHFEHERDIIRMMNELVSEGEITWGADRE